jgi:hypothetical protein
MGKDADLHRKPHEIASIDAILRAHSNFAMRNVSTQAKQIDEPLWELAR